MKLNITSMLDRVVVGIVATVALSAGATLIKTASAVSVLQSERVDDSGRLERIETKIDKLLEHAHEQTGNR